jgi:vancomycin aglycone glucosyltransferase
VRVLLSTIGSRGDVQPLVALARQLQALGHDARLCVPPDFRDWIDGLGLPVTTIGPELRRLTASSPSATAALLTPERRRQLAEASVAAQFETVAAAAEGCHVIVAATALQIAARSVAENLGIGYVFAGYCPVVFPSSHHPPPPLPPVPGEAPLADTASHLERWRRDTDRFNRLFGPSLNTHRAATGLPPVDDVRGYVFGARPWLAADPALAPWPDDGGDGVFQTGAWLLPDERPLPEDAETFLTAGDPPVYFGFGSIRAPRDLSAVMIASARALGRRAIVSRGWADLALVDDCADCLSVGEINQQALFPRVAAVVHHGGAGTTTAAAMCGTPQVVVPQMFDQHYWAARVEALGIGAAHAAGAPTAGSLTAALERALTPGAAARARSVAGLVRRDGARIAAERLVNG